MFRVLSVAYHKDNFNTVIVTVLNGSNPSLLLFHNPVSPGLSHLLIALGLKCHLFYLKPGFQTYGFQSRGVKFLLVTETNSWSDNLIKFYFSENKWIQSHINLMQTYSLEDLLYSYTYLSFQISLTFKNNVLFLTFARNLQSVSAWVFLLPFP